MKPISNMNNQELAGLDTKKVVEHALKYINVSDSDLWLITELIKKFVSAKLEVAEQKPDIDRLKIAIINLEITYDQIYLQPDFKRPEKFETALNELKEAYRELAKG